MRASISALLKHSLEETEQQKFKSQERDKVETERYLENLRYTKVAAWTGFLGVVLGVVAIVLQLTF